MTAATAATQVDGENPWPGLDSFEENARAFFFGRDHEAALLLNHVRDAPVTVLYGRSGLGKTSLLRAGLFPLLREHHFLPVHVRFELQPGATPLARQLHHSIRDSIRADVPDAMLPSDDESLWGYLHRADFELWSADNYPLTPVIVLDQFEELFTLGERVPDLVEEFMNDLGDLAENRIPADLAARIDKDEAVAERFNLRSRNYKLLISLREDFLPELEGWCRLIPALGRSRVRLHRLRAGEAFDAVHKPAAHLMTDELARRVVGIIAGEDIHRGLDTAGDPDRRNDHIETKTTEVEPALLSLFCRGLNEERKRRGQPQFDERLVEDARRDILSNYYSSCVGDLPPQVARFIESELITEKGFRNSYAREDAVPSRLSEDELAQLISSRLVRLEDRYGAQRIELTHDVLTRVVREHRDQRRAEEEKAALSARVEEERQATAQRQAELDRERRVGRRLRWLSAVLAMVCVAAVILAVVALNNSHSAAVARAAAEARSRDAAANELVAEGLNKLANLGREPDDVAMQLILAARTFPSNNAVEYPILSALQTERDLLKIIDTHAWVNDVTYSPNGRRLASASQDKTVRIWDADTGQPVGQPLRGHDKHVTCIAYSPDSRRLATASHDKTVRIWDADTGQPVGQPLRGHDDSVNCVAYSPDGHRLATASADKTVRIWDADTGQPVGAPMRHDDIVWHVAFSPDGHRLVSGSGANTVRQWDADTGHPVGEPLSPGRPGAVITVAFSPDGHRIAVGGGLDFAVHLIDADSGRPAGQLNGHAGAVNSVAFSPDGHTIATGSDDRTVRLWDAQTGEAVGPPLSGHRNAVSSVAFSPHGKRLVSGAFDDTVRVWDMVAGRPLTGHQDVVDRVAFSPDGHRLASASWDETVRIWDAQTRQPIGGPLIRHHGWVNCVAFSPDGQRLATAGNDETVRIWDADTGQPIGQPLHHDDSVNSVAFSPDGHRLATASDDKTLRIWDADTLAPVGDPLKHDAEVIAAVFSPDGQHIATSSLDRTMRLWDAHTGHLLTGPVHHEYQDLQLGFSPDGHRIVAGSFHNTVPLWDAQTLQASGDPLVFAGGMVPAAAFSPDGTTIAATSNDGTVQLWNARTSVRLGPALTGHTAAVTSVAFSPDSRTIVTGSIDKTLRLWPVPTMSPDALCAKLTQNMSQKEWDYYVPTIRYHTQCPGLPVAES